MTKSVMTEDSPGTYVSTNPITLIQEKRRRSHLGSVSQSGGRVFRAKAEPQQEAVRCAQDGAGCGLVFSEEGTFFRHVRDRGESSTGTWEAKRGKLKVRTAHSACRQSDKFLHPDGDSQLICNSWKRKSIREMSSPLWVYTSMWKPEADTGYLPL